jgi:GxxExxY protein
MTVNGGKSGMNPITSDPTGSSGDSYDSNSRQPRPVIDVQVVALNPITEKIIGCVYRVSNQLGSGFLEKVYENALAHEMRKAGLHFTCQQNLSVWYDGIVVGDYVTDFVVEERILIELKAVQALDKIHMAQCINYLKATGLKLCLLINFGTTRAEIKRIAL